MRPEVIELAAKAGTAGRGERVVDVAAGHAIHYSSSDPIAGGYRALSRRGPIG